MTLFVILLAFVIAQRIVELGIAKRNEKILKRKGAYEVGEEHYKWIILLHVLFFASLILEVFIRQPQLTPWSILPFTFFVIAQGLRAWALLSLGHFWNTKIIVLPGADVISKGPYKYLRHPNYIVVGLEMLTLPLIFEAYITMILFSLLNGLIILKVRIPDEEKALMEMTNYKKKMHKRKRFIPTAPRK
ncbi:methyltransferase [Pullulanibacillus pueri]|uniref:15-methylpalmitoyl-4-hydroxy-2-pyrone 4-O-methyltransferase n=1 Tax=Pullulanibacillus pueri TaxID=1437324 RepID=A0A8J3ENS9_9BACL|nr:isoprenylcysteine carboxylmethyltransferase family protein [Pullulanibacillus pueri]MBM7683806.1 methyltransferase [Pullulanibacillus pueri]GGH87652.1 hypothetical protein GCM10007096_38160 [Pullulanibacillus pueri]